MKDGMMQDNRMVKENHQEGISRVMQKDVGKKAKCTGKMGMRDSKESNWKRSGESLTPRKA